MLLWEPCCARRAWIIQEYQCLEHVSVTTTLKWLHYYLKILKSFTGFKMVFRCDPSLRGERKEKQICFQGCEHGESLSFHPGVSHLFLNYYLFIFQPCFPHCSFCTSRQWNVKILQRLVFVLLCSSTIAAGG